MPGRCWARPRFCFCRMILLPIYLGVFLGDDGSALVKPEPFIHTFLWLIAVPILGVTTSEEA